MLIIISTNFEFTTGFHPIPAAAVTGGSTAAATIKVTITTLNNPQWGSMVTLSQKVMSLKPF